MARLERTKTMPVTERQKSTVDVIVERVTTEISAIQNNAIEHADNLNQQVMECMKSIESNNASIAATLCDVATIDSLSKLSELVNNAKEDMKDNCNSRAWDTLQAISEVKEMLAAQSELIKQLDRKVSSIGSGMKSISDSVTQLQANSKGGKKAAAAAAAASSNTNNIQLPHELSSVKESASREGTARRDSSTSQILQRQPSMGMGPSSRRPSFNGAPPQIQMQQMQQMQQMIQAQQKGSHMIPATIANNNDNRQPAQKQKRGFFSFKRKN